METQQTSGTEGDRPQWLGSLVRRGDEVATPDEQPVFDETAAQWLGSVAGHNDGSVEPGDMPQGAGWTGSPVRSAVFAARAPELERTADATHVAAATIHELGHDRVVMGALGMTLRVAA